MQSILKNWKTSASGLLMLVIGVAGIFGIHVAGFTMEPGAAIAAGLGLLLAQDATTK